MKENVKIISSNKVTRMYFDPISNTSKPVFCFDYCIELAGEIADFIRLNTDICRKDMVSPEPRNSVYYLDDENIVKYSFMHKYFSNYLLFKSVDQHLHNAENVLIVDDNNTTGTTVTEVIRRIREYNDTCNIYVFTLTGSM